MADLGPDFVRNIKWQIPRRQRVQALMLRQYVILRHDLFSKKCPDHYYPMLRMAQAAFSLWRSVFLAAGENDSEIICRKTESLLGTILRTNTYSFTNDLNDKDITVAYYNTNARYRIERLCRHDKGMYKFKGLKSVKKLLKVQDDDFERQRKQMEMWDLCCKALEKCFKKFEKKILES
jgi:hypothetical protein